MSEGKGPQFLGRGWAFPPQFNPLDGTTVMVEAEEDIVQSLRILMETRPGERIMHPTYGCRIHDLVFDTMDGETTTEIEVAIQRAILFFEPRITLNEVEVSVIEYENNVLVQDPREGRMMVRLDYTVIQTNARNNMVFPFYRDEGTLITEEPIAAE